MDCSKPCSTAYWRTKKSFQNESCGSLIYQLYVLRCHSESLEWGLGHSQVAKDRKVASGQSLEESLEDLQKEQQKGRETPTEKPCIPAEGRPGSCWECKLVEPLGWGGAWGLGRIHPGKKKNTHPHRSSNFCPAEIFKNVPQEAWIKVFSAALFARANNWTQLNGRGMLMCLHFLPLLPPQPPSNS